MPTDKDSRSAGPEGMSIAALRTLRLALGTSASLWFSQAVGWPLSFIAPIFTMFLLALPTPAPSFKMGASLVVVLTGSMYAGALLLLPALTYQPVLGLLLVVLSLFWSFYFTATGGSQLIGSFATIGIALTTAIGSISIDAVLLLANGLALGALVGIVFVWLAHLAMPDRRAVDAPPPGAIPPPPAANLSPAQARWSALRSLLIVFPVAFWFLLSPASAANMPVMLKVAAMGQQAASEDARRAARSLVISTVVGGIGAIIGWQVLSIAPTLTLYALVIALGGLLAGPRIFKGRGMHADAETWSYAYLTMIVILAPAVMDSVGGGPAGAKFLDRLMMFAGTAVYAVIAIYVTDAFRPRRHQRAQPDRG